MRGLEKRRAKAKPQPPPFLSLWIRHWVVNSLRSGKLKLYYICKQINQLLYPTAVKLVKIVIFNKNGNKKVTIRKIRYSRF